MKHLFILISCLLFACLPGKANPFFCQKKDFASLSVFMQSHISNAIQDGQGFMWFATWNGLIRYDGYNFHTFKPILHSNGEICSNRIYNIKENQAGDLWCISSDNRLFVFDTSRYLFTDLHLAIPAIADKRVKTVSPLENGVTWVTFKDFSCLRMEDRSPQKHPIYLSSDSSCFSSVTHISSIRSDEAGHEWVLTDQRAIQWNPRRSVPGCFHHVHHVQGHTLLLCNDGRLHHTLPDGTSRSDSCLYSRHIHVNYTIVCGSRVVMATDKGVYSYEPSSHKWLCYIDLPTLYLFQDSKKRVWAMDGNHTVCLIPNLSQAKGIRLSTLSVPDGKPLRNPQLIFEDKEQHLFLKPAQGVFSYFDEKSQTLLSCPLDEPGKQPQDYAPQHIRKYVVDHSGNLWVFYEKGVDCLHLSPRMFHHHPNPNGLETRAMGLDKHRNHWIADRSNALCIRDSQFNPIGYLNREGRVVRGHTTFSQKPMYCISESEDGELWIGTKGEGIYRLIPDGKGYRVDQLRRNPLEPGSLCSDTIYDILFDAGRVWIGSYSNGLSLGERQGDTWTFRHLPNQPDMKIRHMVRASPGVLLLGTSNGLFSADLRDPHAPRFFCNRFRQEEWGLKGNDIMRIILCDNHYYVCVFGSGISRIDSSDLLSQDLHFTNFLIPTSQTHDQIKTALAEGDQIWVVAEQALLSFSTLTHTFRTYATMLFQENYRFSEASPLLQDGRIVLGTSDGVLTFCHQPLPANLSEPSLSFTGIQYPNDATVHPLNNPHALTLNPSERSLTLHFSPLDYQESEDLQVCYCLDGYETGWNYVPIGQTTLTYHRLPPGDYTLRTEIATKDGIWCPSAEGLSLHVRPRFVETIWFHLLVATLFLLLLSGMAYAIVYLKHMRNLLQKKYSLLLTVDQFSQNMAAHGLAEKPADKQSSDFLEASIHFLNQNIDNPDITIDDFARHLGMSRTAYYQQMKHLTGLAPVDFVKQMRIKKALQLLDAGLTVTEAAYRVGFADPKYFSRCFKSEMNLTPSQYLKEKAQAASKQA